MYRFFAVLSFFRSSSPISISPGDVGAALDKNNDGRRRLESIFLTQDAAMINEGLSHDAASARCIVRKNRYSHCETDRIISTPRSRAMQLVRREKAVAAAGQVCARIGLCPVLCARRMPELNSASE